MPQSVYQHRILGKSEAERTLESQLCQLFHECHF